MTCDTNIEKSIHYPTKKMIKELWWIMTCGCLSHFGVEPVHESKFDICRLLGLGATYPKHVFFLKLFLFLGPYVQMISNWYEDMHDTQTQHILNIYHGNFKWDMYWWVLIHVEGVHLWHRCLKLQSFPKKSQNSGFKICEPIWLGTLSLFWTRIIFLFFEDDLNGVLILKKQP